MPNKLNIVPYSDAAKKIKTRKKVIDDAVEGKTKPTKKKIKKRKIQQGDVTAKNPPGMKKSKAQGLSELEKYRAAQRKRVKKKKDKVS